MPIRLLRRLGFVAACAAPMAALAADVTARISLAGADALEVRDAVDIERLLVRLDEERP